MIKVEVIEDFTLNDFNKLQNIIRKGKEKDGALYKGDTFECDKEMADYLTGNNKLKKEVVKVIEVKPEKKILVGESVQPIEKVIEVKIEEAVKKTTKKTKKAIKRKKGE